MFKFKRILCKHEYRLVTKYKADVDCGIGYDVRDFYTLYCPKCRKTIDVETHEYERIIGIQKIDEEFKNKA